MKKVNAIQLIAIATIVELASFIALWVMAGTILGAIVFTFGSMTAVCVTGFFFELMEKEGKL